MRAKATPTPISMATKAKQMGIRLARVFPRELPST